MITINYEEPGTRVERLSKDINLGQSFIACRKYGFSDLADLCLWLKVGVDQYVVLKNLKTNQALASSLTAVGRDSVFSCYRIVHLVVDVKEIPGA